MNDRPVTVIVSDLHVGGGSADPGDDHVYDENQFVGFLEELLKDRSGAKGEIELIINGDFLEFAQVLPERYTLGSADYWCSEEESHDKLTAILNGHGEIFEALRKFQAARNRVTIAPGNHDVDLYWNRVQETLRSKIGAVQFELSRETYSRYQGKLVIGHGHMYDPANTFKYWAEPRLFVSGTQQRLEMCPGTLFMVKFVNWLEKDYKFADNVIPITALGRVLWKEDKLGLLAVAWTLSRFAARHPSTTARTKDEPADIGRSIRQLFKFNDAVRNALTIKYNEMHASELSPAQIETELDSDDKIESFLLSMFAKYSPEELRTIFDAKLGGTLSIDDRDRTLKIVASGTSDEKTVLQSTAKKFFYDGAEVVVFGHTHQPDEMDVDGRRYFNPGSWTRYVKIDQVSSLSLKDLKKEEDFPYQLNFIRVAPESGRLVAEKICFEKKNGNKFRN